MGGGGGGDGRRRGTQKKCEGGREGRGLAHSEGMRGLNRDQG